jgi:protein-tyrosine phosphatase
MTTHVLLVCMGNICRSPTAEGVLRHILRIKGLDGEIKVDSAGTHSYHSGEPPDRRAQLAARRRGIDLSKLRARRVEVSDFERFDLILAMDRDNLRSLEKICPDEHRPKLGLFLRYARQSRVDEVPDPYYGGDAGFELVVDMALDAAEGLIDSLRPI